MMMGHCDLRQKVAQPEAVPNLVCAIAGQLSYAQKANIDRAIDARGALNASITAVLVQLMDFSD
jgi:hypothetical protein